MLVTQICFGQVYQQNRKANPNIKNSQLDRQDKHFRIIDRNIQVNKFNGFPISKIPDKFRIKHNNIDVKGTSYPFVDDKYYPNGHKASFPLTNKIVFPLSQIYVIDTAIVISELDTTRHLYSFNASAKRTSDMMQKLIGGLWVDTLRHTTTYDANNNILTDWFEYWANGQWMNNGYRDTYTYDASIYVPMMRITICLQNYTSIGKMVQWMNSYRYTNTYDANNNMLTAFTSFGKTVNWCIDFGYTNTYDANNNMLSSL